MSAQKFTPGPWEAERLNSYSASNERPWVGRLSENRYSALSCGDTQDEAVANANLIASAPDMYEALAHSTAELMAVAKRIEDAGLGNLVGGAARQCDINRAALAKTRGE